MNAKSLEKEMISLRREFHQIPEVAFEEFKTSKKIKEYLEQFGMKDIKSYASTGIAAVVYGKNPGKTIGVRVDIDALPVTEENEIPYRSTHPGKMHACGHDAHIAIGLGLAKVFYENRESLSGNVKFIFQPAEEGVGGAEPMIKEGVLQNPTVDYMLGCHLWPEIPSPKIDITSGSTFASSDVFQLHIKGFGGHGGMPEKVKDCVYAGAKVAAALKELYFSAPYEKKTVISVCSFEAPSAANVYPASCVIKGTIRTLSEKIRAKVKEDIRGLVTQILDALNIPFELTITPEYPTLANDDKLLSIMERCAKELFGDEQIIHHGPTMAAEDFAFFTQALPSCHVKIGCGNSECCMPLHNPKFNLDESAIVTAASLLERMILELLKPE